MGRCSDLVVSVIALNTDDQSSNPGEVNLHFSPNTYEKAKINGTEAGVGSFLNN